MTNNEIETAIGQHLADMFDCPPIAWPNKDFVPDLPYIEFRHAPNERYDDTADCSGAVQLGIALATVVSDRDAFSTEANDIAQDIADRFPKGLRIAAGSGNVLINQPCAFGSPFVDGVYWRQPVTIRYMTEIL